jgi:carboxyl-terminal processing protease
MRRPLAALFAAILCAGAARAADDMEARMKTVIGAYAIVEGNAADPVSADQALYQGAIPGLLRNLDPHSVFFDPEQFQQVKRMERSTQKGFGTIVSLLPGRVIALQVTEGTPSA